MQRPYLSESDAYIERPTSKIQPFAKLCDDEGCCVAEFPNSWTDEQIMLALRFANRFWAKGVEYGRGQKVEEIKACLGLDHLR